MPAGKHSVLNTECSLKERQWGDPPSCEQQGHSPIDKVPGHFSFTPFLFEGLCTLVRYADDALMAFDNIVDAKRVLLVLQWC